MELDIIMGILNNILLKKQENNLKCMKYLILVFLKRTPGKFKDMMLSILFLFMESLLEKLKNKMEFKFKNANG